MEFTIVIEDEIIGDTVKKEMVKEIQNRVTRVVQQKLEEHRNAIEKAVELYLAKRLTDKEIITEIEQATKRIIEERIGEI